MSWKQGRRFRGPSSGCLPGKRDRIDPQGLEAAELRLLREAPGLEAAAGSRRDRLTPDVRTAQGQECRIHIGSRKSQALPS